MNEAVLEQSAPDESAQQPADWRAYDEVQDAIERLYLVVWDRWHPLNPATDGRARCAGSRTCAAGRS
ncbi:MAG: hypothetical protein M9894_09610 [Planctomycetes bacterium]|nr:hypothetical protein [Planctomycetota bacterium]